MSKAVLPTLDEEWKNPPVRSAEKSLVTPLGLVEGDVLLYLEAYGSTALRQLIRELEWPTSLVTMAVGALVREGLIHAVQHELEVNSEGKPRFPLPTLAGARCLPFRCVLGCRMNRTLRTGWKPPRRAGRHPC